MKRSRRRAWGVLALVVGVLGPQLARAEVEFSRGVGVVSLFSGDGAGRLGLGVEGSAEFRLREALGLRLGFGWGFTEFERAGRLGGFALDVAEWTAEAYVSVSRWLAEDVNPELFPLKLLASLMAYAGLTMGFALSVLSFALMPVAATGFLQLSATVAQHFRKGGADAFLEAGLGGILALPSESNPAAGVGPIAGAGVAGERFGVSLRWLWSPPLLHSEKARTGSVTTLMVLFSVYDR